MSANGLKVIIAGQSTGTAKALRAMLKEMGHHPVIIPQANVGISGLVDQLETTHLPVDLVDFKMLSQAGDEDRG